MAAAVSNGPKRTLQTLPGSIRLIRNQVLLSHLSYFEASEPVVLQDVRAYTGREGLDQRAFYFSSTIPHLSSISKLEGREEKLARSESPGHWPVIMVQHDDRAPNSQSPDGKLQRGDSSPPYRHQPVVSSYWGVLRGYGHCRAVNGRQCSATRPSLR